MKWVRYRDYIRSCLRYYARHRNYPSDNEVLKKDWLACHKVLSRYSDAKRHFLTSIYRERDTLADNVYSLSKSENLSQDEIWREIEKLENEVAKQRGLA